MTASSISSQHLVNRPTAVWPRRSRSWVLITGGPHPQPQSSHCDNLQRPVSRRPKVSGAPCTVVAGSLPTLRWNTWRPYSRASPAGRPSARTRAPHIPSPWQQRPGWGAAPRHGADPSTLPLRSRWGARESAPEWSRPWGHHTAGSIRGRPDPRRPPPRCSAPPNAAAASKPPQP